MRRVVGRTTIELAGPDLAAMRSAYPDLVLDLGCGDGKHALTVARQRADALVVGVDAAPDAMRRTAARAAARPAKGGVPNVVFVWAAAADLPPELVDVSELHCLMPWGSLLRGMVEPDAALLRSLAARCRAGAPFLVTLNLHAWRPPVPEVGDTPEPASGDARLREAYAAAGWTIERAGHPDADELAGLGTSWTKRLGSSRAALAVLALRGHIGPPQPAGYWRQYS